VIPEAALDQISGYLSTPSTIRDHGKLCCQRARAWLRVVDSSNSYRDGQWHPPTWLRVEYEWGPVPWPIHWCSIPEMDKLDCGALAAVAGELYRLRGYPVSAIQLALRYPSYAAEQWTHMWEREGMSTAWIHGAYCYHEACGVIRGQAIQVWDPTENRWLSPPDSPYNTFASVVAIKIAEPRVGKNCILAWEGLQLRPRVWQSLVFNAEGRLTTRCRRRVA
jgi:hypothetical protein